jgi:hypothetical protein
MSGRTLVLGIGAALSATLGLGSSGTGAEPL